VGRKERKRKSKRKRKRKRKKKRKRKRGEEEGRRGWRREKVGTYLSRQQNHQKYSQAPPNGPMIILGNIL
jgi:hypothetical protein